MTDADRFLREAIELAHANVEAGGRPFGAVVVGNGEVIATGVNETHKSDDVTDHAELLAIRAAVRAHGSEALGGSTVYASGHPCPMCLAAMRLAGVSEVVFAYSNEDGAPYSLSTAHIYDELRRPFSEHSMKIAYVPARIGGREDLYAAWSRRQAK